MSPSFHRLESTKFSVAETDYIECSFETKQFGYVQVKCSMDDYRASVDTLDHEPSREMFTNEQWKKIEHLAMIANRLTYESPAATERFERNV